MWNLICLDLPWGVAKSAKDQIISPIRNSHLKLSNTGKYCFITSTWKKMFLKTFQTVRIELFSRHNLEDTVITRKMRLGYFSKWPSWPYMECNLAFAQRLRYCSKWPPLPFMAKQLWAYYTAYLVFLGVHNWPILQRQWTKIILDSSKVWNLDYFVKTGRFWSCVCEGLGVRCIPEFWLDE